MRILIANYRYFVSGGPERYMFNLIEELNAQGHETIPFSIKYNKNKKSAYENYFVDPLGNRDEILYRDQRKSFKNIYRTALRLFYDPEVEKAVIHLVKDTNPQIAYILHYLRKLSPAVLVGIKKKGIPIVVRISDYMIACPGINCLRDEKPCELCIQGNVYPSIRYRCVQNSLIASLLNALAVNFYRSQKYFDLIDKFVVTNYFMYKFMVRAGYPEDRLTIIPTFTNVINNQAEKSFNSPPIIMYVGRIVREKGVHALINAVCIIKKNFPGLKFVVKIIGAGEENYINELVSVVSVNNLQDVVSFVGHMDYDQIINLLQKAYISIVPSLWYENLPNSLLESFACGTPVIGSDIGSLSCAIKDRFNGLLFSPGDAEDLAQKIKYCLENVGEIKKMGENAKATATNDFSPNSHIEKLLGVFNGLVKKQA